MKTRVRSAMSWLGVAALAVFLPVAPAQATQFVLDQWNIHEMELAGAKVLVDVNFDGVNTTVTFTFDPGALTNTLIGFDIVGFQSEGNVPTAPGWTFEAGKGIDGFGKFHQKGKFAPGADPNPTFVFVGDLTALLNDATDFAVHVRLRGRCSGFAGGHNIAEKSDPDCVGVAVSEPASVALVGAGLILVGMLGRRWRRGGAA